MSLGSQISLETLRAQLDSIRTELQAASDDPTRWAFREAASVLSRFEPQTLRPVGDLQKPAADWIDLGADCEPVAHRSQGDWWRLRPEIRRQALRRLGTRERMRAALAANPDRPDDLIKSMRYAFLSTLNKVILT
jgi:hypothetical protein